MHSIKWWLVLALFVGAVLESITGHSSIAIALALLTTIALWASLELELVDEDADEHGLTLERLALVLVYARQHRNATGESCGWWWLNACRRLALGVDRW